MNFEVLSIDALPRGQWDNLTGHSFLSSPEFTLLWDTMGGQPRFLILEEQGRLLAGMAGVIFGPKYLRRLKSMPDSLHGGPFFSRDSEEKIKNEFFIRLYEYIRSEKCIRIDIANPPNGSPPSWLKRRTPETHFLALTGDSYSPPDANILSDLRRAQKENLQVRPFDKEEYLEDFYKLVIETCRRHGKKPRYTRDFFRMLLRIARSDNRVIWPMAVYDGDIIASHIRFIERSEILCWQSFWDKKYRRLNPNHLLLDYLINYAIAHNIREINLGGSPPEARSLIRFKEAWGGRKRETSHYSAEFGLGRIIYGWGIK
jgi:hypothetical protein